MYNHLNLLKTFSFIFLLCFFNSCKPENMLRKVAEKRPDLVREKGEQLSEQQRNANWPDTLKETLVAGTYRYEMQQKFKNFSKDICGCVTSLMASEKKNFVPKDFEGVYVKNYFNQKVEKADKISSLALFYYPFTKNEIVKFDNLVFDPTKILFDEYDDLTMPVVSSPNFSDFFYSSSCSNYLYSALDGKASSPVPFASLQAGLKSDKDQQATIVCIGGNFVSPLLQVLKSNSNEARTIALMKLWNYYSRVQKEDPLYVLKSFEGISFNTSTKSSNAFLVNTTGVLNFNAGLAALNGKIQAGQSSSSFFKANEWTTLLDEASFQNRDSKFEVLPSVDGVINHFNKNVKRVSSDNNFDNFYQNYEHRHTSIFKGIPIKDRNSDDWEVVIPPDIYESQPTIEIDKNHSPLSECKFIIKGVPNNSLFQNANDNTVTVSYRIQRKNKVGAKALSLNVDKLTFSINKEPLVYDRTVNPTTEFSHNEGGGNITYKWSFKINLLDSRSLVRYDAIPSGQCIVVNKDDNETLAFSGSVSPVSASKTFSFDITSTVSAASVDRTKIIYSNAIVTFRIYLGFQIVERTFNVNLPVFSRIASE